MSALCQQQPLAGLQLPPSKLWRRTDAVCVTHDPRYCGVARIIERMDVGR
jgi:hypothetical protein